MVNSTLMQWTVLKTPAPAVGSADHDYCEKPKTAEEMLETAHSRIEELEATCVALQSKTFSWIDFQMMHRACLSLNLKTTRC